MDRQGEPLNETQESKQAEREEVVAAWIERPINRIRVQRCLSGKNLQFEKLLEALEVYQDKGMYEQYDRLVKAIIQLHEKRGDFIKALVLKIKSATYLYRYDWKHAKRLLASVITSDLPVEYSDVIKARAYCSLALVARIRRKEKYKTNQLLEYLERSEHLLRFYDLPEDWAVLYLTYGCVWMDYMYMSNLPLDRRDVVREKAMDYFRRAIYYSEQDHRARVKMKIQIQAHFKVAMIHLGYCSTFASAQENHIPLKDIKEAENHLDIILFKFGNTIPMAARFLFMKTQSDLFYHKGQYQPAKDKAEDALECASRLGFNTVTFH